MRSDGCLQLLWTLVQQECVGMIIYIIANYLSSQEYSRVSGILINLNEKVSYNRVRVCVYSWHMPSVRCPGVEGVVWYDSSTVVAWDDPNTAQHVETYGALYEQARRIRICVSERAKSRNNNTSNRSHHNLGLATTSTLVQGWGEKGGYGVEEGGQDRRYRVKEVR